MSRFDHLMGHKSLLGSTQIHPQTLEVHLFATPVCQCSGSSGISFHMLVQYSDSQSQLRQCMLTLLSVVSMQSDVSKVLLISGGSDVTKICEKIGTTSQQEVHIRKKKGPRRYIQPFIGLCQRLWIIWLVGSELSLTYVLCLPSEFTPHHINACLLCLPSSQKMLQD